MFRFNPFTKKLDLVNQTVVPPGTVTALKGNDGIAVGPDGSGNINVVGTTGQAFFSGNALTNTLTLSLPGAGFNWQIKSADFTAAPGFGYLILSAGNINVTLPSGTFGDSFAVVEIGSGTWTIKQNASDSIKIGNILTTTGAGGSIASTQSGDNLTLVCWADGPGASWVVVNQDGNLTVV